MQVGGGLVVSPHFGGVCLTGDQLETLGTRFPLYLLKPFASQARIRLHLKLTQGERGLQLQTKKTQVAGPGQRILSSGLRSTQVFIGCHDVSMIEHHRDSNHYIVALLRKPDGFGNGGARLVYLSLLQKGHG